MGHAEGAATVRDELRRLHLELSRRASSESVRELSAIAWGVGEAAYQLLAALDLAEATWLHQVPPPERAPRWLLPAVALGSGCCGLGLGLGLGLALGWLLA